jgi:hypothetical protein
MGHPLAVTKAVTAGYRFFAVFLAAFLAFFAIQLFPPFIRDYGAESHHRSSVDCPWARTSGESVLSSHLRLRSAHA